MDLCRGKRLIDQVIEHGAFSEKDAMIIMKELLEAIKYIHENGIIHRDIKLENIMMDFNPTAVGDDRFDIKLVDFGLSVKSNNIKLFKKSGTPGYVAPEILTGENYGEKVDIFSLGVVLFTM